MMQTNSKSLPMLLAGMMADPSRLEDINVLGLTLDSRQVQKGYLFFSLSLNGNQRTSYLKQALTLGASVVLFDVKEQLTEEEILALEHANVSAHQIKNLAEKVSEIAARFYGHPSMAMTIIAVTGTNGKTSVTQFIAQSLELLAQPCGVIGTLGTGRVNQLQTTGMTTPDPIRVQAALTEFYQQNIKYVVIEASSHALEQGRLNSVDIDVAVLTNLSRDHLDYHQDMASYAAAKKRLFDCATIKTVVINSDDEFGQQLMTSLLERNNVNLVSYSRRENKIQNIITLQANAIETTLDGLAFNLVYKTEQATIKSPLIGRFNIDNLLAVAGSLLAIAIPFDEVAKVLVQCQSVDGRMQRYGNKQQPQVVIDFAHTPDALEQALVSLRTHLSNNGLLWCVFGCGGDRDTGKRPLMGSIAELNADRIVLTDDNPRSEIPAVIVQDILSGIKDLSKAYVEHNRKLAITYAISQSKSKDIILIAGKGHEQYQEVLGVKHPFNDASVVKEVLLAANDAHQLLQGAES